LQKRTGLCLLSDGGSWFIYEFKKIHK